MCKLILRGVICLAFIFGSLAFVNAGTTSGLTEEPGGLPIPQRPCNPLNFPPMETNGFLDVTVCGATGLSTGDDTQAIVDGVKLLSQNGGGILFFPKGFYNVGRTDGSAGTPNTAGMLPIDIPSGITLQGINGGINNSGDLGNSRITMGSPNYPNGIANKAMFKIGENRSHITIRDITLLAYNYASPNATVPGSIGLLAEGNYPNTTLGILFSNMTFWGFDTGVDVRPCTPDHVYMNNCAVNPNVPPNQIQFMVPWQFDNVKADHVQFGTTVGVKMDSENTDWNFSSCWFHMPPDPNPNSDPVSYGLFIKRGGFIQLTNTFGGAAGTNPGGTFIYAALVGTLSILNSQTENIKNSIVFGRNHLPGEPTENDLGTTAARIVIVGSEFGAPIKLKYRVTFVSTGNHYDYNTIQTYTPLTRVYSTGDKFCGDGFISTNNPCPNPGIVGPATVVFATGSPAEITTVNGQQTAGSIQEVPNKFGLRTVFSRDAEVTGGSGNGPLLNVNSWNYGVPLFRLGQPNFYYDFKRNENNGFLLINANQGIPYKGVTINGLLQLDPNTTYDDLVTYANAWFNGLPVISNGAILYCNNCGVNVSTGECTNNGEGALAKRISNAWKCN